MQTVLWWWHIGCQGITPFWYKCWDWVSNRPNTQHIPILRDNSYFILILHPLHRWAYSFLCMYILIPTIIFSRSHNMLNATRYRSDINVIICPLSFILISSVTLPAKCMLDKFQDFENNTFFTNVVLVYIAFIVGLLGQKMKIAICYWFMAHM
jgi:hypothetical protein